MAQSYFLEEFVTEIVRTGGAALAPMEPPPTRESVLRELAAAAFRALERTFGDNVVPDGDETSGRTPVGVSFEPPLGETHFHQYVRLVERVADPAREIEVAQVRALGREFADIEVEDVLGFAILYDANPSNEQRLAPLRALPLPLPVHSAELWENLSNELNAVLLRYFPAPTPQPGTLGALLADDAGWARGLTATSGDFELELEGAHFEFERTRVQGFWLNYGFTTVLRRAGEEVYRGRATTDLLQLEDGTYVSAFAAGAPCFYGWESLPSDESARSELLRTLQDLADGVAGGEGLHGHNGLKALLVSAIRPPSPTGIWAWMHENLPRLCVGHAFETRAHDDAIRFEVIEVDAPILGLESFGSSAVGLSAATTREDILPSLEGLWLQTGQVDEDALTLRGPETPEEDQALETVVARFLQWLDDHLAHHARNRPIEELEGWDYFYAFDGYFPLPQLLVDRIKLGPPPPEPTPFPRDAAVVAAPRLERAATEDLELSHAIAAFRIDGWTIALTDDLEGRPFGSHCGIFLVPPDGGPPVHVLMVDPWNPPNRRSIDGDAFAFRRFVQWLREAILASGQDFVLEFMEEEEEWEDSEDEDEGEPCAWTLEVSDWLLFGLPDVKDRHLVDWRTQWHIVSSYGGIEGFASMCGFTGEYLERLVARDAPLWRRFLGELVNEKLGRVTR